MEGGMLDLELLVEVAMYFLCLMKKYYGRQLWQREYPDLYSAEERL